MKSKHIFALCLAVMLLLSLLGACTGTPAKNDENGTQQDDAPDGAGTPDDDAPVEIAPKTVAIMNPMQLGRSSLTFDEAKAKDDALLLVLEESARTEYGLILDRNNVDSESYLTTLNGYIAADTLPDVFTSGGLAAETLFSLVDNAKLANLDDVFAYSNGTAYDVYYNDGCMALNRPANTLEDGGWYWFNPANCNPWELNLDDTVDGGYFADFGVFTIYPLCLRYDWLQ